MNDNNKTAWSVARIDVLQKGDSLVCEESGWRIDCVDDLVNPTKKVYYVIHEGVRKVKKVRSDALVTWLIAKGVPTTLKYVPDDAINYLHKHYNDKFLGVRLLPTVSYIDETESGIIPAFFANLTKIRNTMYNRFTFLIQEGQWSKSDE